ncbi:MAG: hypothetical protein KBD85_00640 [Elusimicrobia bacterium]|nr:hypothetical protein [Elusimicrobiota bacterium]MBP9698501.1 hypothetical protein [Elusimicrobiota bacterium]
MKITHATLLAALLLFPGAGRTEGNEDRSVFVDSRSVRSSHFVVRHEEPLAPAGVLNVLEGLHSKLLLDLGVFSPWAYHQPLTVYLYRDAESYHSRTGMAAYVKAHIRVQDKEVFGYMAPDFQRVMAHELGHLYFSQFFLAKSTHPPLWLNEGVATLMEWDYGLEGDRRALEHTLRNKGTIPFADFLAYSYQQAGPHDGERVGDWYNQAQSVTRLLVRGHGPRPFYTFCDGLRNGRLLDESLCSAYGLAIPDTTALERLWTQKLRAP